MGIELAGFADFLNQKNIPIAQYRNKQKDTSIIREDLKLLKSIYRGRLILNDHIDLVDFADGLHLGQEDLLEYNSNKATAIKEIKAKIGDKILGLSTHNADEIEEANSFKELNYIGLGAYRNTTTKENVTIGGRELLDIAAKSKHKVAIIGGVCLDDDFSAFPAVSYKVIGSDLMLAYLKQI